MAVSVGGRVLIAMLVVLGLLHNAAATTYAVGGTASNGGWTLVQSGGESYDDQFKNIKLVVGDVLSFVFTEGQHNVLEVPAADVSTCKTGSATQTYSSSVNVTLTTSGSHGFICGITGHCSTYGMQLLVTVNAAAAPVSAPVASPHTSPVASPVATPVASPHTAPVASPVATPVATPVASPVSPSPPGPVTDGSPGSPSAGPAPSAASVLQTGPAIAIGALLAACAVLAL